MSQHKVYSAKTTVNGVNLYYERHGIGKGKPLVFIAGFTCDHHYWDSMVAALAADHELLLLDNRGMGQSDSTDDEYDIALMADDVMALLAELGIALPVIIGQSMGSLIAQTIGKRYADRIDRLVLINTATRVQTAPLLAFELTGELQRNGQVTLEAIVQSIVPWIYSSAFLSVPGQLENLFALARENPYPPSLQTYYQQLTALKAFDSEAWLYELSMPALVIAAAEDIICPPLAGQVVADAMGDKAQFVLVPGGHASPIEQPGVLVEVIGEFVAE